jgi:hypothetical protein
VQNAGPSESWASLDDRMGWEALVLAASLKRFFTSKYLTVLIDETNVSTEMT